MSLPRTGCCMSCAVAARSTNVIADALTIYEAFLYSLLFRRSLVLSCRIAQYQLKHASESAQWPQVELIHRFVARLNYVAPSFQRMSRSQLKVGNGGWVDVT